MVSGDDIGDMAERQVAKREYESSLALHSVPET